MRVYWRRRLGYRRGFHATVELYLIGSLDRLSNRGSDRFAKPPTGKSYKVTGAFRLDFSGGKIRGIKSYWDTAAMARQLGLMG